MFRVRVSHMRSNNFSKHGYQDDSAGECLYERMAPYVHCMYSRVQKSWNEVVFKILKKPSIVQKKMTPHIKGLDFLQR